MWPVLHDLRVQVRGSKIGAPRYLSRERRREHAIAPPTRIKLSAKMPTGAVDAPVRGSDCCPFPVDATMTVVGDDDSSVVPNGARVVVGSGSVDDVVLAAKVVDVDEVVVDDDVVVVVAGEVVVVDVDASAVESQPCMANVATPVQ
jgi:hypothetical protein